MQADNKKVTDPHLVGDVGKLYYKAFYEEKSPSETEEQYKDRREEAKRNLARHEKILDELEDDDAWSYQRDFLTIASYLGEIRWDERKKMNDKINYIEEIKKKELKKIETPKQRALEHFFSSCLPAAAAYFVTNIGISILGIQEEELSYAAAIGTYAVFSKKTEERRVDKTLEIEDKYAYKEKEKKDEYRKKMRSEYSSAESEVFAKYEECFDEEPKIPPTSRKLYRDKEREDEWIEDSRKQLSGK